MLTVSLVAYLFLFKPSRDLIENYIFRLDDKRMLAEYGIKNISFTLGLNVVIGILIYFLVKYDVGFIELIDIISLLIVPWIFVIGPISAYIQVSKNRYFYGVILISFIFFVLSLINILQNLAKKIN